MSTSQPKPSFVSDETCQLTRDASRMFQNLGMVEIGSTSREIVLKVNEILLQLGTTLPSLSDRLNVWWDNSIITW